MAGIRRVSDLGINGPHQILNIQTKSASYSIGPTDRDSLIYFDTTSSSLTVTVDTGSLVNIGDQVTVMRYGVNSLTIVAGTATLRSTPGLVLRARYSAATIIKVTATEYLVSGDVVL